MIKTGKRIIYCVNGVEGFLASADDLPGVEPIEEGFGINFYDLQYYDDNIALEAEDNICSCYCYGDIEFTQCVNPENPQKLLYGWWSVEYAKTDEFLRMYNTWTNRYYDWKSSVSSLIEDLRSASEEEIEKLKNEWETIIKEELERLASEGVDTDFCEYITFAEIYEEAVG